MYLLLFGYPSIIILIMFEERTVTIWNICLVPKQRKKWGISERRVQILCKENRIPGVSKIGYMWLIPKSAVKPFDKRIKRSVDNE